MKIPMCMLVFPDYEELMRTIRSVINTQEQCCWARKGNYSSFIEIVVECRSSFTGVEYFIMCINDNFGGIWYIGRDYSDLSLERHFETYYHESKKAYKDWARLCTTP
jgi:hypothetical protein